MKTFQKIMGKIVNLLIILVVIAIIFCLYFIISIKVFHKKYINFFGYSIFEVATGSMQKTINVGDAVLIKLNGNYEVGDIVTYKNGNDFITHRVVSIDDDYIITKGDNNNVNDNPIDKSLVVGKVIKILPKVGIWKKVLLTPKVIILIIVTLFIFSVLFSYDGKSIKIISSKKYSRFFSLNFLLSVNPSKLKSSGNTQQAATTGPTKGPRPTSSTPPIKVIPVFLNSFSYL